MLKFLSNFEEFTEMFLFFLVEILFFLVLKILVLFLELLFFFLELFAIPLVILFLNGGSDGRLRIKRDADNPKRDQQCNQQCFDEFEISGCH